MKPFYSRPAHTTARLFQDLADYHDKQDKWGATMGLFFDVAGALCQREAFIPAEWRYSPGLGGPEVSEWNEEVLRDMPVAELLRLGQFCHRLTGRLDRAGLSY